MDTKFVIPAKYQKLFFQFNAQKQKVLHTRDELEKAKHDWHTKKLGIRFKWDEKHSTSVS